MKKKIKKNTSREYTYITAVEFIKQLYHEMLRTSYDEQDNRRKIVDDLMKFQQTDGTWRVIDDMHAPTDIRVEYIYIPTYYATAALMAYMNTGGIFSDKEKEYMNAGLIAATGRKLNGSGYEATRYRLEALNIYKSAGLYEWMNRFGNRSPEFCNMILQVINGFRVGLMTGRTYSDWNRNFEKEFLKEVSDYEEAMVPWVWYAAYGSNLSKERFMSYVNECTDQSEPVEDRRFEFPYNITFAGRASIWGNQGKAFLDDSREGMALGRIYKIRRSQFEEIQRKEGHDYTKRISLGWEDGIPVYTFTAESIPTRENSPSANYMEVILCGLKETYPEKSELALEVYLFSHDAMTKEERAVLNFIRNSEHGVSLQQMADEPECPCLTASRKAVSKLISWQLIKQDNRSREAGHRVQDREAVFYTRKDSRDLIDILLLLGR